MGEVISFFTSKKGIVLFSILTIGGLFLPSLFYGTVGGDDLRFHLSWFVSYKDAISHGNFYPRWLPDQMAGMGSPALYFYPPFSTFFLGLVDVLSLHQLPELRVFSVAAFLMALLSGASFYVWARIFVNARIAAYAALFYTVAPYHLLVDYYTRTAMAEYAAYIWIPMIFAGVHKVISSADKKSILLLAIGIAGLFCTHLLTAMIIAPTALLYAVFHLFHSTAADKKSRLKKFGLLALTGVSGVALAAFYFVPAILLLKETNAHALNLHPVSNTALFRGMFKPESTAQLRMSAYTAIYFMLAAYLIIEFLPNMRKTAPLRWANAPAVLWAATILLLTVMMGGAFAFVFKAPSPYEQIQFLWRMLMFVEFSVFSLFLYVMQETKKQRVGYAIFAIAVVLILSQAALLATKFNFDARSKVTPMDTAVIKLRLSPSEYFPNNTTFERRVDLIIARLQKYTDDPSPATIVQGDASITSSTREQSSFAIDLTARTQAQVTIHQFYFPGWRATDENGQAVSVVPFGDDKLASFIVAPGRHHITVARSVTSQEKIGIAASCGGVMLLLALLVGISLTNQVVRPARSRTMRANELVDTEARQ